MRTLLFATLIASTLASEEVPKLTVSGASTIRKAPDFVTISIGVEEEDKNASDALQKTAAKIEAILKAVKPLFGKEDSITTDTISLSPIYDSKNQERLTIGYRAVSSLNVRTPDLKLIGKVIDLSSKAGANRIDSITFSLKDDRASKNEALTNAAKNAIESAETLAKAANIHLKRLLTVHEDSGRVPVYRAALMTNGSFPVEPGDVEVTATVSLTYEIEEII